MVRRKIKRQIEEPEARVLVPIQYLSLERRHLNLSLISVASIFVRFRSHVEGHIFNIRSEENFSYSI
ncbi:hypothetical protein L6164_033977 [Bauhinia variegata]|uniref:Uncharacterized protein n=1 Tax=Bauhinia variegata TaxID=167791 RepID=A0ACB9KTG0_BAUVA|nr:hypothetical protein L6164_033977 [Bauhinia variegata]